MLSGQDLVAFDGALSFTGYDGYGNGLKVNAWLPGAAEASFLLTIVNWIITFLSWLGFVYL
jgi:hypothetical protein